MTYEQNLVQNDSKLTGISENSIFNSINYFHVVDNYSLDIMHDIFEVVAIYNMGHLICNFIRLQYFSLEIMVILK